MSGVTREGEKGEKEKKKLVKLVMSQGGESQKYGSFAQLSVIDLENVGRNPTKMKVSR